MHAYVAVPGMAWDDGDEVGPGWGDGVGVRVWPGLGLMDAGLG